eukprot:3428452-Pyramimonas_sp.AAC.1
MELTGLDELARAAGAASQPDKASGRISICVYKVHGVPSYMRRDDIVCCKCTHLCVGYAG